MLPRLTTMLALLLAALLVMTQTLGVVHSITHGQSGSVLHSDEPHHSHGDDRDHQHADAHDHAGAASSHFLSALFSLHEDASDCRLYDQASHDGALLALLPLVLPVVPPPLAVAIFQGEALARWAALFDARGPPLTV